jgi:hypothetical protein
VIVFNFLFLPPQNSSPRSGGEIIFKRELILIQSRHCYTARGISVMLLPTMYFLHEVGKGFLCLL